MCIQFQISDLEEDWLNSCGFTFKKDYSVAIDSQDFFPSSVITLFASKCPINPLCNCNHNVIADYCTRFAHTFDPIDNIFINFFSQSFD